MAVEFFFQGVRLKAYCLVTKFVNPGAVEFDAGVSHSDVCSVVRLAWPFNSFSGCLIESLLSRDEVCQPWCGGI